MRDVRAALLKATFKPSKDASAQASRLARFGFPHKHGPLRLCLGRSLVHPSSPDPPPSDTKYDTPIRGEQLFAGDVDLWIALVVEANEFSTDYSVDAFRAAVEAHVHRGALLLAEDWQRAEGRDDDFVDALAVHLPTSRRKTVGRQTTHPHRSELAVEVALGTTSTSVRSGASVSACINGEGGAPHIALMGKNGTGKTRTGKGILAAVAEQSGAPVLVIDPKGDFDHEGHVEPMLTNRLGEVRLVRLGREAVPLEILPSPTAGSFEINQAVLRFCDSFSNCLGVSGEVQRENLREAAMSVVTSGGRRGLEELRDAYERVLVREGKDLDVVLSKLRRVTTFELFAPSEAPADFFSRSWVVSLNEIQAEEIKRFAILMLLDSLRTWLLALPDSTNPGGFRSVRHVLFLDEARRVLADRKYESLVDLVRQSRSKGGVTMLLSQDPSDFMGAADDFTSQLGTVVAFQCAAHRGLRALQGAFMRKLQPAEFSDSELPKGVALVKRPGHEAEKVQCWTPTA